VKQLVWHHGANALGARRVAVAGEVVLGGDEADAAIADAAVDAGVAVGGLEIAEVDIDPVVATERSVVERRAKACGDELRVGGLGRGRHLLDERHARRCVGTRRGVMNEHATARHAERRLAGEGRACRLRRGCGEHEQRRRDVQSCFHSTL
jgi:hypothetical protein